MFNIAKILLLIVAASVLFVFTLGGCGEPCESLAKKICDCRYEVRYDKESCKRSYIEMNPREFTDLQSERCEELLDICSCDDLKIDGNQGRCGVSNLYE